MFYVDYIISPKSAESAMRDETVFACTAIQS